MSRQPAPQQRFLYHHTYTRPRQILLQRALWLLLLLAAVIAMLWLLRDHLRDSSDNQISFVDVVYFTFVTITTVGYGDIVPIGDTARLIDALLLTPVRIFVWLMFIGTAYELVFERVLEAWRMRKLQADLNGHVVVIGYGPTGQEAVNELRQRQPPPPHIVVIETDEQALHLAADLGCIGLRGDGTQNAVLTEARIANAEAVLVCTTRDDTNVLSVLSVRQLAPQARIVASARAHENVRLLYQAGANEVVTPFRLAGRLMADATTSHYALRFVADLVTRDGVMEMIERAALPTEHGVPMSQLRGCLVIGLERAGSVIGFWERPDEAIQIGDTVFAIQASKPLASTTQ